jgi:predicted ATPase/class 3 adenylate cyclase
LSLGENAIQIHFHGVIMLCSHCSYQNPEDAKFCQNCGKPLARVCPNCRTQNASVAKFCKNCGFQLETAQPLDSEVSNLSVAPALQDLRLARLAAATPAELADKMRAASHLAGERRVVTALFADVVGSTALAEQMDPEDWTLIMNHAFEALVPAIYHYEGTIARLMGDALLAFFGAPVAHEDDPVRAVHAGLDLLAAARSYAEEVRLRYGIDFAIRVGLNTGPVVVGQVGSNLVYEYTAMGDAVNLAARMQSAAQPMSLLITENTYRFVAPVFDCQDIGEIAVKGKRAPVQAYQVSGLKSRPESLRGVAGLESAMVGRQAELEALMELCSALSAGLGRAALIMGEAGLGKSRLIAEWKAATNNSDLYHNHTPTWLEGHCLSYGQSLAYHLVNELLRNFLGVSASAGDIEIQQTLQARCVDLLGENEALTVFPFLGHMLSLHLSGEAQERVSGLDPQALQSQYLAALRKVLRALAGRGPLVLVLEDIHWADTSSIDLLVKLMPLSSESAVLFCAVSRPDHDAPGWRLVSAMREIMGAGLTEINLHALTEKDARQLVANLLEIEALPEKIRKTILNKAEGNPFFVEEVIRMLIDQGAIVRQERGWAATREVDSIDLPDTLQGLLLARIDRLPEDVKHTLRVASVIGRQFSVKVLEQILGNFRSSNLPGSSAPNSSLLNQLNMLESLGLLKIAQVVPELEYNFRHAMVHEVTYYSLVKRDRQILHLAVGEALEHLYPDRLVEFAPTLGLHFEEGKDYEKAVKYLSMAGDQAAGQYANQEAWMFYSRALKTFAKQPTLAESQSKQLIHLYLARGRILELMGRYEQALDNYVEMEESAHQRDDKKLALSALVARTIIHSTPTPVFDPAAGESCAAKGLTLAEQLGDQAAEAKIHWALILQYSLRNMPEEARKHGEQSLILARKLNSREQLAYTLSDLANFVYIVQGDFERGIQVLEEAQGLWQELGNLPLLSNCIVYIGFINYFLGRFDLVLQKTDEAYRISQSINNLWGQAYSQSTSAYVYLELGDAGQVNKRLGEAIEFIEQSGFSALKPIADQVQAILHYELGAIEAACQFALRATEEAESEFQFWFPVSLGVLASALIRKGEIEAAQQAITRANEITRESGTFLNLLFTSMAASELELARGDNLSALEKAELFLQIVEKANARTFIPYGLFDKGRALAALGRLEEAEQVLKEANRMAEQLGSRRIWWKCLASLAEVTARRGDQAQAEIYRGQGREITDFIAEHAGSEELRDSFLSLPEVQRVYA